LQRRAFGARLKTLFNLSQFSIQTSADKLLLKQSRAKLAVVCTRHRRLRESNWLQTTALQKESTIALCAQLYLVA
jgi:hypothetical protein